jgi:hypothetical protein
MKVQQPLKPLRNAAAPFTIHLGNDDYYLGQQVLHNAVDDTVKKQKGWYSPEIELIHFKKGNLKLKAIYASYAYDLVIGIEKDKLHVACSCKGQVQTLCIHSFKTLDRLTWYNGSDFFRQFRPGGLYEMSKKHKKYFTIEKSYRSTEIKPKEFLRSVYALSRKPQFDEAIKALALPSQKTMKDSGGSDVLCYMIVNIRRKDHPPFVVPCMGKLNKTGTAVKGFHQFLSGAQKENDHLLTEEQKLLNSECLLLYKEAEKLPGHFFPRYQYFSTDEDGTVDLNRYADYFARLEKLLMLLNKQPYVFTCNIYWKRDLKKKPYKNLTQQVSVSTYQPQLSFLLRDRGDFFQLEMNLGLGYKTIRHCVPLMLFLMQDDKNNLYQFASLTDAFMVEWFHKTGNRVTIFKEHFKDFEKNFLSQLAAHYEIKKINPSPVQKKK